jgi:hypothetical protein
VVGPAHSGFWDVQMTQLQAKLDERMLWETLKVARLKAIETSDPKDLEAAEKARTAFLAVYTQPTNIIPFPKVPR